MSKKEAKESPNEQKIKKMKPNLVLATLEPKCIKKTTFGKGREKGRHKREPVSHTCGSYLGKTHKCEKTSKTNQENDKKRDFHTCRSYPGKTHKCEAKSREKGSQKVFRRITFETHFSTQKDKKR